MKLSTINRWLRKVNLVLVVVMSEDEPDGWISFRVMTFGRYTREFHSFCQCAPPSGIPTRCPGPWDPAAICVLCNKGFPAIHQA